MQSNALHEALRVISEAHRRRIELFLDNEKLKYKIESTSLIDPVFVQEITRYKNEIKTLLGTSLHDQQLPADVQLLNRGESLLPWFIFPGTPGFVDRYEELARAIRTDTAYGLRSIGLAEGEKPISRVEENASFSLHRILKIQPQGPYRFIGHSLGAHVAFETARQLEKSGKEVSTVIILDTSVNLKSTVQLRSEKNIDDQILDTISFFTSHYELASDTTQWRSELNREFKSKPAEDRISLSHNFIEAKISNREDSGFMVRVLGTLIIQSLINYTPAGKTNAQLFVIKAKDENWDEHDRYLGWQSHAARLHSATVPGDHLTMVNDRNAVQLGKLISAYLKNSAC